MSKTDRRMEGWTDGDNYNIRLFISTSADIYKQSKPCLLFRMSFLYPDILSHVVLQLHGDLVI